MEQLQPVPGSKLVPHDNFKLNSRKFIIFYRAHLEECPLWDWITRKLNDHESVRVRRCVRIYHMSCSEMPITWVLVGGDKLFQCDDPTFFAYAQGVDFKVMTVTNNELWKKISSAVNQHENGEYESVIRALRSRPVKSINPRAVVPLPVVFKCKCGLKFESESALDSHACANLSQSVVIESNSECIICMDAERSVAFLPCGHARFCGECAESCKQRDGICPNCRSPIKEIVKIYS